MSVKRLRTLCIKVFKTLNSLNPNFMKEIFSLRQTDSLVLEKYKLNVDIRSYNQVTFGRKALTFFGSKTWNSFPYHIKPAENLASFKTIIKFWNGETIAVVKINFIFDMAGWKFLLRNSGLSGDSPLC